MKGEGEGENLLLILNAPLGWLAGGAGMEFFLCVGVTVQSGLGWPLSYNADIRRQQPYTHTPAAPPRAGRGLIGLGGGRGDRGRHGIPGDPLNGHGAPPARNTRDGVFIYLYKQRRRRRTMEKQQQQGESGQEGWRDGRTDGDGRYSSA